MRQVRRRCQSRRPGRQASLLPGSLRRTRRFAKLLDQVISGFNSTAINSGLIALAEIRNAFDHAIDQIIRRERLEEALDRVAFVGVSQGTIVALDAVASGRWKVGALIGYSGLLPLIPVSSDSSGTPVLLVHGQNDRTMPPFATTLAASQLQAAGFAVDLKVDPSVGHTISMTGAGLGLDFLRKYLA